MSTSKDDYKAGYEAGIALSCAAAGMTSDEFKMSKAASDVLYEEKEAQVAICKIAKYILAEAGDIGTEYAIYDTIEKSAGVVGKVAFDTYLAPVLRATAEVSAADSIVKSAGLGWLGKVFGHSVNLGSDTFKTLLAAAALTGTLGGGAWWSLNRGPEEDDVDTQLKRDQAKYYRDLARDLKVKIAQEEARNPRIAATRAVAEDNDYVL